jgi:predicted enzyme related to lactoylglutathione lyase
MSLREPGGTARLSFQTETRYRRPVWPASDGTQQMMVHLDIEVDDLQAELARAVEAGAEVADYQPQELVRVCVDPAGHPFCLWVRES